MVQFRSPRRPFGPMPREGVLAPARYGMLPILKVHHGVPGAPREAVWTRRATMSVGSRLLLAAAFALGFGSSAYATCVSTACPDPTAMDNVRALIASGCDCAGAAKHAGY